MNVNNPPVGGIAKSQFINWRKRNSYYHDQIEKYMTFYTSKDDSLLVLGCGTGEIFKRTSSRFCVGIDADPVLIQLAKSNPRGNQNVDFYTVESYAALPDMNRTFDIVVLYNVVAESTDIQAVLQGLRRLVNPRSRLILNYHSHLWSPILQIAEKLGLKRPAVKPAWVTIEDMLNLFTLADYEPVSHERCMLFPKRLFGIGPLLNMWIAPMPIVEYLCLENVIVIRPLALETEQRMPSVTVVIPARNEAGNIENAIKRLPPMGSHTEVIFVEGHSTDQTLAEIERVQGVYPQKDIKVTKQTGIGKGDAVRKGFAEASGDILMILDADLTMAPEDLPKYYRAIVDNKGELINGCRLVYPVERQAMRFLNMLANKFFGWLFTWLLGQRYRDTLCGTKVLWKRDYERIVANRSFFGDFDPFGDFDLIFGAARLALKTIELPIQYRERTYGSTNISRFTHGWLLLRMSVLAAWRLKFRRL